MSPVTAFRKCSGTGSASVLATSSITWPCAVYSALDFGAKDKYTAACANAKWPSGAPRKSNASFAASVTASAPGSANPISSLAMRTNRRARYNASSPDSSMRVSQYSAASGSELRTDLCSAEIKLKCSSPLLSYLNNFRCKISSSSSDVMDSTPFRSRIALRAASSNVLYADRASPFANEAMRINTSSLASNCSFPSPCSLSSNARRNSSAIKGVGSAARMYTFVRDNSGEITSNEGFSVVAPINVMCPASTYGRNASCCALLKRCTSSTNTIVRRPDRDLRSATAITSLISLIPANTALNDTNSERVSRAINLASVVFPHPGGPHSSIDPISSFSICVRSGLPGPSNFSWPINSSSVRGRMRSANGWCAAGTSDSSELPPGPNGILLNKLTALGCSAYARSCAAVPLHKTTPLPQPPRSVTLHLLPWVFVCVHPHCVPLLPEARTLHYPRATPKPRTNPLPMEPAAVVRPSQAHARSTLAFEIPPPSIASSKSAVESPTTPPGAAPLQPMPVRLWAKQGSPSHFVPTQKSPLPSRQTPPRFAKSFPHSRDPARQPTPPAAGNKPLPARALNHQTS